MEFSEEWKSLWPICEVYSPPLLIDHPPPPKRRRHELQEEDDDRTHEEFGPIMFAPCPRTLVQLYSSLSLAPRFPLPYPRLSLARFLQTSATYLLGTDSTAIASEFGPQEGHNFSYNSLHGFNSLQLLSCDESLYLAFFPTGENCDQVGFFKLCMKDSEIGFGLNYENRRLFTADSRLYSRILKLLVNPVSDYGDSWTVTSATSSSGSSVHIVGYVMACTMYSVHWYSVKFGYDGFGKTSVLIEVVGQSLFRSSAVIHACWSPHLSEESVVLTETGELYLFDVSPCVEKHSSSCKKVGREKLNVLWGKTDLKDTGQGCWLSVEFSWHPRILIVAHVSAIFMVDARLKEDNVSCLLKIEMVSSIKNDRFFSLCRAGCDGFNFCVASRNLLHLCDVRQPFRPVLKWVHNLHNPCYVTVFRLSELRSDTRDDRYKWATESGSCILLGSFWNCEFSLFIYGPKSSSRSVSSDISKFCSSFYSWGLPSEFSLSANDTHCGDCLVREEFSKEALPSWVDWRQKRELVMGFSILNRDPWAQLPKTESFGGFTLIRLMSSGKLEAVRYEAVCEFDQNTDECHPKILCSSQADLLYDLIEEKHEFQKRPVYLMFEYLGGFLKGDLDLVIDKKLNSFHMVSLQKAISGEIDKTSESDEVTGIGSVSRIFDVLKDINMPTSVYEICLKSIWAGMPKYLVQLASSCRMKNPELPEEIESFGMSDQTSMPQCPFEMHKIQDSGAFLPLHFLLTLHRISVEKVARYRSSAIGNTVMLSADDELKLQCNRVMEAAANSETDSQLDDGCAVSLADDNDDIVIKDRNPKKLSFHEPVALLDEVSKVDRSLEQSGAGKKKYTTFENFSTGNKRFAKFLFQEHKVDFNLDKEMVGQELLNVGCPVELKFNDRDDISFEPKELKTFQMLKKQDLDFQRGFDPYQEYLSRTNLVNQKK